MAQAFQYVNTAVDGLLGATINSSATSIFLSTTPTGYPNPATAPFRLVLDLGTASEEIVTVTAGAGTSGSPWTITRGQDGTTATGHTGLTATVAHRITAGDENLSRAHEALTASTSGAHGLPASAWATAAIAALDEITFSSATPSVTWSSIPGTYKHLIVIASGRLSEATQQSDSLLCTLNGDAGANYSYVAQYTTNVSGSSTGALFAGQATASSANAWPLLRMAASQAGSSVNAGGGWAIIPNYAAAAYNKGFYSVSGAGDGTSAFVDQRVVSGWYNPGSQAAVTSITLTAPGSSNFLTGSFIGLYGLS